LERELGAALFDRDRHRVALTDAGLALLPEARATLAAAQAAQDAVAQARAGLRGTLTVGTMVSIGTVDVAGLLGRFHLSHPGVSVHLRHAPGGSAGLAAQVIAGELDLALVALPGPAPAGLRLQPLSEEPLVLIAPRSTPGPDSTGSAWPSWPRRTSWISRPAGATAPWPTGPSQRRGWTGGCRSR